MKSMHTSLSERNCETKLSNSRDLFLHSHLRCTSPSAVCNFMVGIAPATSVELEGANYASCAKSFYCHNGTLK